MPKKHTPFSKNLPDRQGAWLWRRPHEKAEPIAVVEAGGSFVMFWRGKGFEIVAENFSQNDLFKFVGRKAEKLGLMVNRQRQLF